MDGVERLKNRIDEIINEFADGGEMDTKEKVERIKQNLIQHQHRLMRLEKYIPVDSWNGGDWTSLETVEIGDTVGGCKIEFESQKDLLRATGIAIRIIGSKLIKD